MTHEMTDERLAELDRLCVKATPGPWGWDEYRASGDTGNYKMVGWMVTVCYDAENDGHSVIVRSPVYEHDSHNKALEDVCFIVAARTALPELLAEVRRLRADLDLYASTDPRWHG